VSAGLIIAGMLYDSGEIKQVKDNAATAAGVPSVVSINGQSYPGTLAGCTPTPTIGCVQVLTQPNGLTFNQCTAIPTPVSPNPPTGWTAVIVEWNGNTGGCFNKYLLTYNGANGGNLGSSQPGTPSTQQVQDYLTGLPASNPLAPESQNQPAGTTNPAPAGSTATTNLPVSPSDMPTTVVPANNVPPGSSVVDPNAPAPTQQTQTTQQSSTTTTTTNPDGSQTDQSSATVSCTSGQHSNRTFGSVLQDHYNVWSASGLLGTLELLKNLSWPTTFPTYTLHSTVMGTFTFEFNAWSGVINALRALVIAGASFVAYRIIFIGGH
jgi:hypothetical protein